MVQHGELILGKHTFKHVLRFSKWIEREFTVSKTLLQTVDSMDISNREKFILGGKRSRNFMYYN